MLSQERVKRTLATTASVEARLPVQAQQILRQVRRGWINHRGVQNSPQPEGKSENRALREGTRSLQPSIPSLTLAWRWLERGWRWAGKHGALPSCCLPSAQELGCFTRKELRYFTQYVNWVGQTVSAPLHLAGILGAQEPPRIPHGSPSRGSRMHPRSQAWADALSLLLVPAEGGRGFVPAARHGPGQRAGHPVRPHR